MREIDETLSLLERADVVLHGVGRADDMARKRQLPADVEAEVLRKGAVAEAYGCYFDRKGRMVYSASTVSHDLGVLKPNCALIAVAAGAPAAIGAVSEDPKSFVKALIFVVLGEGIALYGVLISILILSYVSK
jgi:DNA-binding transcriptional regulator LsrR (DeoR family)